MKRTALDHPKLKRLASLLGLPHFGAVGICECLWNFTAKHAIRGEIGKWSNQEIADAIGWPSDDADRLVAALVESRLLDHHRQHRYVVHDWKDHLDESARKTIMKYKWAFAAEDDGLGIEKPTLVGGSAATIPDHSGTVPEQSRTVPDQVRQPEPEPEPEPEPSQSHSHSASRASAVADGVPEGHPRNPYPQDFETWWVVYPKRTGKRAACTAWTSAVKRIGAARGCGPLVAHQTLLDVTGVFAKSRKGQSGRYCPNPATWLNEGRYDDDPKTWNESDGTNSNGRPASAARVHERDFSQIPVQSSRDASPAYP